MRHPSRCPSCGISWYQPETIYEYFFRRYQDEDRAREAAANYGCTPDNPQHFSVNVIGTYNMDLDCTTHWQCQSCEHSEPRFP